jgi:hypothetical protein
MLAPIATVAANAVALRTPAVATSLRRRIRASPSAHLLRRPIGPVAAAVKAM